MTRAGRPPRYRLTAVPRVRGDIDGLAAFGVEVVDAARAIADDLAHGRVVGKRLAGRNVSGDLTGCSRVKFDLPARRPQRFRLLYREVDNVTLKIVAVGVRDQHAIYRSAVARLRP